MRTGLVLTLTVLIPSILCQFFQPSQVPPTPTPTAIIESSNPIKIELVDVTMIYYEINGSTADDLRKAMNRLGPLDPTDGLHYDARSDWHISWNWPGYGESECDLSQASVDYDIKVTVPYWNTATDMDPVVIDRWNRYMTALELHEQGHVDITVNNYLKVRDAIQAATCDTTERAAQEAIEEIRSLQAKYDQQTRHGNLQGAVFP